MTDAVSSDLWYGVCGDKHGWFDPKHVTLVKISEQLFTSIMFVAWP